ncbi:MAG: hypothetical protein K8R40_02690 [Anaerolineaceae bacterium]|nr:hypothetical protein [Anaerolineaceae bacterium]
MMPWQEKSTQSLTERLFSDIKQSVKQRDSVRSDQYDALCKILVDLADRLQGQRMDDLRKADPSVPAGWSVRQWKQFWETYDPHWNKTTDEIPANHPVILKLEAKNRELVEKIETLKNQVKHAQDVQDSLSKQLAHFRIAEKKREIEKKRKKDAALPDRYRQIVLEARNLPEQIPSQKFQEELLSSPQGWPRKHRILYIMAHTGWAARLELDHVLSLVEGVSSRSGSIKRVLGNLMNHKFIEQATASFARNEKISSLIILRFTKNGLSLCSELGWEVVESEWEKLQEEEYFTTTIHRLRAQKIIS